MHTVFPGTYDLPSQQFFLPSGGEINYYEYGSPTNPTLVLLHGMGNYAPVWFKLMQQLGKDYHCLAIDLPGHGESPALSQPETITSFAAVVEEFVAAKVSGVFHLVGHSMGGQVVLQTCLNERIAPKRIVLLAPAGFEKFTDKDFAWLSSIYRGGIIAKLGKSRMVNQFMENFHQFPEDANFMLQDVTHLRDSDRYRTYCDTLSRCARAGFASPVYDRLEEVQTPALVYYGQSDLMVPHRVLHVDQNLLSLCQSATSRMAAAELRMLADTGHMLHWEAAEQIGEEIISFLKLP